MSKTNPVIKIEGPHDLAQWMALHFTTSAFPCADCVNAAEQVFKLAFNAGITAASDMLSFHMQHDWAGRVLALKQKEAK